MLETHCHFMLFEYTYKKNPIREIYIFLKFLVICLKKSKFECWDETSEEKPLIIFLLFER